MSMDALTSCQNCGRSLDPANQQSAESGLCLECAVASAESRLDLHDATPTVVAPSAEQKRNLGKRAAIAAAAVIVAAVVVAWPTLLPGGGYEAPLRQGNSDTDVTADECIENIAILFELDADGEAVDLASDFECPASDAPYVITWSGGEDPALELVACPEPGAHGLSSISMSAGEPAPTVGE